MVILVNAAKLPDDYWNTPIYKIFFQITKHPPDGIAVTFGNIGKFIRAERIRL